MLQARRVGQRQHYHFHHCPNENAIQHPTDQVMRLYKVETQSKKKEQSSPGQCNDKMKHQAPGYHGCTSLERFHAKHTTGDKPEHPVGRNPGSEVCIEGGSDAIHQPDQQSNFQNRNEYFRGHLRVLFCLTITEPISIQGRDFIPHLV